MDCSSFSSSFLVFVFAYNMPDFGGSKTLFRIRYQHSLTFLSFCGTIYIRESREYALKSTEPSRDGSQCKARHISMPGFVGLGQGRTTSGGRRLCDNRRKGDRLAIAGFGAEPHVFLFLSPFSAVFFLPYTNLLTLRIVL